MGTDAACANDQPSGICASIRWSVTATRAEGAGEQAHHPVAGGEAGDAGADLGDDAGAFAAHRAASPGYMPRAMSTSRKFRPAARIATRTCPVPAGSGSRVRDQREVVQRAAAGAVEPPVTLRRVAGASVPAPARTSRAAQRPAVAQRELRFPGGDRTPAAPPSGGPRRRGRPGRTGRGARTAPTAPGPTPARRRGRGRGRRRPRRPRRGSPARAGRWRTGRRPATPAPGSSAKPARSRGCVECRIAENTYCGSSPLSSVRRPSSARSTQDSTVPAEPSPATRPSGSGPMTAYRPPAASGTGIGVHSTWNSASPPVRSAQLSGRHRAQHERVHRRDRRAGGVGDVEGDRVPGARPQPDPQRGGAGGVQRDAGPGEGQPRGRFRPRAGPARAGRRRAAPGAGRTRPPAAAPAARPRRRSPRRGARPPAARGRPGRSRSRTRRGRS